MGRRISGAGFQEVLIFVRIVGMEIPLPQGMPPADRTALIPGTLYLVATPIGNLEDITLRALRVLRECDLVAAEDTRHTGRLLQRLGLSRPMVSCHHFNEARRGAVLLDRLREGQTVALVSDAGSPGVSDPGERVVAAARAAGLRVEPVPGPCALVAALTASGLPTEEFHFVGFLPHKPGQRRAACLSCPASPARWSCTNPRSASSAWSANWHRTFRIVRWSSPGSSPRSSRNGSVGVRRRWQPSLPPARAAVNSLS